MFYLGTTVLNYLPLAFDDYSTSNPAKSTTFCYSIFPFCPKVHIICNLLALKLTACIYNNDYLLQPFVSSFFAIYPVFQIAEYNATIETLNLKMSKRLKSVSNALHHNAKYGYYAQYQLRPDICNKSDLGRAVPSIRAAWAQKCSSLIFQIELLEIKNKSKLIFVP